MKHAFVILLYIAGCASSLAHEFWLEPERFVTQRAEPVKLSIRVGENFDGKTWTPDSNKLVRLMVISAGETRDVTPLLGKPDALAVTPSATGTTLVALATDVKFIEIAPEKFTHYLTEDGLDNALAWRAANSAVYTPGRELYRREAATLLQGDAPTDVDLSATGFDLRILPQRNPYAMRAGEDMRVQILWRGQPLANALIQHWTRKNAGGVDVEKSRSDAQGYVSFKLLPGATMLSVVHMIENDDKKAADWLSTWGNLTFLVR